MFVLTIETGHQNHSNPIWTIDVGLYGSQASALEAVREHFRSLAGPERAEIEEDLQEAQSMEAIRIVWNSFYAGKSTVEADLAFSPPGEAMSWYIDLVQRPEVELSPADGLDVRIEGPEPLDGDLERLLIDLPCSSHNPLSWPISAVDSS